MEQKTFDQHDVTILFLKQNFEGLVLVEDGTVVAQQGLRQLKAKSSSHLHNALV